MKIYKKIIWLILLAVISLTSFASCKKEESIYGGDSEILRYDPYDNILKDPVNTGSPISIAGKSYVFDNIDIRDADADKKVTACNALRKLYKNSKFEFTAENKVKFIDDDDGYYFEMNETEGVRSGNVLNVKHTNNDGVEYDIRFEIHEDKIYVIHNGHTYNKDKVFSTLTFTVVK